VKSTSRLNYYNFPAGGHENKWIPLL